jgi:hypothetical protein
MYIRLHGKYHLFLLDFNQTWIFWIIFEKSSNIKFHEICPVGAELFHADEQRDGRTDRHDAANTRFSQFCERAWKRPTIMQDHIMQLLFHEFPERNIQGDAQNLITVGRTANYQNNPVQAPIPLLQDPF